MEPNEKLYVWKTFEKGKKCLGSEEKEDIFRCLGIEIARSIFNNFCFNTFS